MGNGARRPPQSKLLTPYDPHHSSTWETTRLSVTYDPGPLSLIHFQDLFPKTTTKYSVATIPYRGKHCRAARSCIPPLTSKRLATVMPSCQIHQCVANPLSSSAYTSVPHRRSTTVFHCLSPCTQVSRFSPPARQRRFGASRDLIFMVDIPTGQLCCAIFLTHVNHSTHQSRSLLFLTSVMQCT